MGLASSPETNERAGVGSATDVVVEDDAVDDDGGWRAEVAITRKVVRSNRMTSVAEQISAKVVRCLVRTAALGMIVWTMRDHAYG